MATLSVESDSLRTNAEKIIKLAGRMNGIHNRFVRVRRTLDWDVMGEAQLESKILRLLAELSSISKNLNEAGSTLQDIENEYTAAHNEMRELVCELPDSVSQLSNAGANAGNAGAGTVTKTGGAAAITAGVVASTVYGASNIPGDYNGNGIPDQYDPYAQGDTGSTYQGTDKTDIQRMMDNVKNDTSLVLTDIKKQTIIGIGRAMLEEGYESAFVAGMLANIIHEGTAGLFESSNYASNPAAKPQYLVHTDNKYNYRSEYSGQNIMNKNLSDVYNILVQLEADNWKKGKFGLGSVQWTGGRTKTLVETYMEVAGASDKITFDQMLKAEGLMISRELSGNYGYIYSDWLSANSGNLNSANAAYSSGYNLCTKYEIPANYTTKAPNRANTAKLLYEIMTGK